MDDVLFFSDSLSELVTMSRESIELFKSRGFILRKWVANSSAKSILSEIPKCDLATNISEIAIGSEPMPDSKALGVVWDVENDKLKVNLNKNSVDVTTRREIASQLASYFDPLGMIAPCILGGKLILQRVAQAKFDWDDKLPDDILHSWNLWIAEFNALSSVSLDRYCFPEGEIPSADDNVKYQLHGFSDASNNALSCVVYLRRIVNGKAAVSFVFGKSHEVLCHQSNWIISRKELEAAKMCSELMLHALAAFKDLSCEVKFWTDSQVVHKWIVNPDLHLSKFVTRRIDKINLISSPDSCNFIGTSQNPADVGTRDKNKNSDALNVWLFGPEFLTLCEEKPKSCDSALAVRSVLGPRQTADDCAQDSLEILIITSPNLYTLKKRAAYLIAFKKYFVAKFKKRAEFKKPILNASYLDRALMEAVWYVQFLSFGAAIKLLREDSPDKFDQMLKRLYSNANGADEMRKINELKTLRNLRPCVDTDMMLRVEGRLENAELPIDTKHPFFLPSRHALTRLIILHEHSQAGHAGPAYTLMFSRQRFWIIFGIGSVKHYIAECGECALCKAKPIRQSMADLPSFRVTIANKPFQICGTDFLGPILYRQNRSECKAWGLLCTSLSTRCLHVEIVSGLDLNNFLLAFSRFTNLRGKVFSDNASTFCAAANVLPGFLDSTEFANSVRQKGINWVKIPPYAPSQGGVWESMVKLFKNALLQVMGRARRKPTLIELQTFASDAVRIVNDRPLTTPRDQPNDLEPITPSCFLGQHLAPNTPLGTFHD